MVIDRFSVCVDWWVFLVYRNLLLAGFQVRCSLASHKKCWLCPQVWSPPETRPQCSLIQLRKDLDEGDKNTLYQQQTNKYCVFCWTSGLCHQEFNASNRAMMSTSEEWGQTKSRSKHLHEGYREDQVYLPRLGLLGLTPGARSGGSYSCNLVKLSLNLWIHLVGSLPVRWRMG